MGVEVLFLLAVGAIALIMMTKKPTPTEPSTLSNIMLYHVGGGISYLRIYVIKPDGAEQYVFSSNVETDANIGQWMGIWPIGHTEECTAIRIEATQAARKGNILGFSFMNRELIKVELEAGDSTVTIDTRR